MKKYILCFIFILLFFINNDIKAEKSSIFTGDNYEIQSDSFTTVNDRLNLIKGSNLFITVKGKEGVNFEDKEPKINVEILDYKNNTVWAISNPKTKAPDPVKQSNEFESFFEKNKAFFNAYSFTKKTLDLKLPLDLQGGDYRLKISSSNYPEIKLDYNFVLSKSAYNFTDFDIIIEGVNVSANIGYESMLDKDDTNKVVVTLSQEGKDLFKKEIEKVFYKTGNISVNENVDSLGSLTGTAVVKIDILDKDGYVILSKTKDVTIQKAGLNKIYYAILIVLLLILVIVFIVFKKKKQKIIATMMVIMLTFVALASFQTVKAITDVEACGSKPANENVVDGASCYIKKFTCQRFLKSSCTVDDVRAKKYFSSGDVVDMISPDSGSWVGPISVKVNVCSTIPGELSNGDNFYVISDSAGSDWSNKRFHIFRFTRGESKTVTFDPDTEKRNVNYAVYNGNCIVDVYGRYSGPSSNYKKVGLKVVETGRMTTDTCKSVVVNQDFFESNITAVFDKPNCSDKELRNTFISGSKTFSPIYNIDGTDKSSWHDKTVNICSYLNPTATQKSGAGFYIVMDQLGAAESASWMNIRYPVFQFKFGTAKSVIYGEVSNVNNVYKYGGDKENVPGAKYDGNCTVTFRLDKRGDSSDSWNANYQLIEAGFTANATCYDPELIKPTTTANQDDPRRVYDLDRAGIAPYQVEFQSKIDSDGYDENYLPPALKYTPPSGVGNGNGIDGGKYRTIAPFFKNMIDAAKTCKPIGQCGTSAVTGNWIPYFDGATCDAPATTSSCVGRDWVTKTQSGTEVSRISNDSRCNLTASCQVTNNDTTTSYKFTPSSAAGNVEYVKDGVVVATSNNTGSYTYSTPKVDSLETVTVIIKDLFDNQTVTRSCNNDYVANNCTVDNSCDNNPPIPPTVNLSKDPKVSLNKNGSCTISWNVQNVPDSTVCTLNGWNIDGPNTSTYNISLDGGGSSDFKKVTGLTQNQKYTINCSGPDLNPSPITTSVICRVNPDVKER